MSELLPGSRVLVFDHLLFKDDVTTPLSVTMRPATVVCRYGTRTCWTLGKYFVAEHGEWIYPDSIDVVFDHRPDRVSRGHFTDGVKPFLEQAV